MKRLVLLAVACSLFLAWGCAKKVKSEPETAAVVQEEPQARSVATLSPMQIYEKEYNALPTSHTVLKGECLWWISEYKQIYNDPFMWPLIFKANRDKIKNPDLIYPGQIFSVPRTGFDLEEVKASRKQAGAPWKSLEPGPDAVIPAQMRSDLGYRF
ncbi:MAG: peptidoglycan-binding protein [Desulfovibrionaceae bacterium]|nr:peptidoglycan-binding protein [Desulfovibrionaceae bacterium]MDD4951729.1 peptidoglycan-binding protein [Desulfovibrionaceae bacterium]